LCRKVNDFINATAFFADSKTQPFDEQALIRGRQTKARGVGVVIRLWPAHKIPRFIQGRRNEAIATLPADECPLWQIRIGREL
jgi:hypothetical protein